MTMQRTQPLVLIAGILLALLALTPPTTNAAVEATAAGNIIANEITAATIDPTTSIATVDGVIECAEPTRVNVYGWVRQYRSANAPFAQSYGGTTLTCGPTPTSYSVTMNPGYQSDRLVPGPASVGFWAAYCTTRCYGHNTEREMRLVPAH